MAGSLWGCCLRNGKYQTSFFHFYYEFQPHRRAALELHNIIALGDAGSTESLDSGKTAHSSSDQVEPTATGHLDHIQTRKDFYNNFQCPEGKKRNYRQAILLIAE